MKRWIPAVLVGLVAFVLAAFAQPAFAQDYTTTSLGTRQYITVPSSGVTVYTSSNFSPNYDDGYTGALTLPFDMPYFGTLRRTLYIHSNGYVQLNPNATPTGYSDWTNVAFTTTTPPRSGVYDGMIAPFWDDFNPQLSNACRIGTFVTGTAPNRVFVVFWENAPAWTNASLLSTFQLHLHETTGRIVFAYEPNITTWISSEGGGSIGFIAGGTDNRFITPNPSTTITTKPSVDYRFDPNVTAISGVATMDALVSDDSGLGNSTVNIPALGCSAELRSGSKVLATGAVAADGTFTVNGLALNSSGSGSVHLVAAGPACRVSPSTTGAPASPASIQVAGTVSFGDDATLADFNVDNSNDSGATFRRSAQIAAAIGRVHAWVTSRTSDVIPPLEVYFDNGSAALTQWSSGSPSYLRIGGASSGNLDAFDVAVVVRGYARHLVAAMTGATTSTTSLALDAKGDSASAAADGLGAYLYAVVEGQSRAYDGTSATQTTVFDLESPSLNSAKAPDVGGWFAAAMYDLVDGANESHDLVDGTTGGADERPFEAFDTLTRLSMIDFVYAWYALGYDSASLVKVLVHHGVLADDADEADDTLATATDLGTAGVRRTGLTLNPFNEDWYEVQVVTPHDSFFADLVYDRSTTDATVVLEIRNAAGGVLATGSFTDATGPMRAVTGAVAPGTLYVRVAHVAGSFVGKYSIQIYGRLAVSSPGPFAWTVGRSLVQPLTVIGGIPPFAVSVSKDTPLPSGLALDETNYRIVGAPVSVGTYDYTITTTDAGSPANSHTVSLTMRVNAPLRITAPALNGIALGKVTDIDLGFTGGTPPITISEFVGEFPEGLSFSEDFRVKGVAASAGGGRISFTATDATGSTASVATTLVTCARLDAGRTVIDLGAGDSAAGFYFDTVAGTTIQIGLTTVKKRVARDLTVLVVGPDGRAVEGGQVKIARGKASVRKLQVPLSGRYFFVFAGADALGATQLNAQLRTVLPRGGSGEAVIDFGDETVFEFGAIDGARFTLQGTTTLGMNMRVDSLIRPDGTAFPVTGIAEQQANGKFRFTTVLDRSGTWRLTFRPRPGPVGELRYRYTLKQPKHFRFTVD